MIRKLMLAGADAFRINMSHTTHARMRELVAAIRAVEQRSELLAGTLHGNLPHAIDPVRRAARHIAGLLEAIDAVEFRLRRGKDLGLDLASKGRAALVLDLDLDRAAVVRLEFPLFLGGRLAVGFGLDDEAALVAGAPEQVGQRPLPELKLKVPGV